MIGFVGLSHLGIVSSAAAAANGCEVVGFDPDPMRCKDLDEARLPIVETGLPELFAQNRSRLRFTSDPEVLRDCELVVCSADVPTTKDDQSDLAAIDGLIETILSHASDGAVIVLLSQVPPGFTRRLGNRITQEHSGRSLSLFYQVETLIFGQAVERALYPERFIVGCLDPQARLPKCYAEFLAKFDCPVLQMRYESAELAKISLNMFLISSVSTANTIAEICETIGADYSEIIPALTSDKRIGQHAYVRPGLGLAGGNLERDLITARSLAEEYKAEASLIDSHLTNSHYRRDWALRILHREVLSSVSDPVIAIWGLAYKPGTRSIKNSPALSLIDILHDFSVKAYDPRVSLDGELAHVTQVDSPLEACRAADALVIMTPWPEFASIQPAEVKELMRGKVIVDPFGVLDGAECKQAGLVHAQLGLPISGGTQ